MTRRGGIIAVEEEEEEDHIPGPHPVHSSSRSTQVATGTAAPPSPTSSRSLNSSKGSSSSTGGSHRLGILSRLKQSQTRKSDKNGAAHDVLQLSNTEHKQSWRGKGILASAEDLDLDEHSFSRGCVLLQAAARGDLPKVQALLQGQNETRSAKSSAAGARTAAAAATTHVNFRDYDRRTALHVAASEGHLHVVRHLVEVCGSKVNRSDRWGGSPLDDANRHRHHEIAEYLRQHGATTGSGNRLTNLIKAAADGDLDEVLTLLKFFHTNAQEQSTTTNTGGSSSSSTGGFGVNQGDYDKRTALHLAAGEGHLEIVRALCDAGAHVNAEDRWGRRPLDDAGGNKPVAALLSLYGAQHGAVQQNGTSTAQQEQQALDRSSKRAVDNMRVEFTELEMIDRIGSGAFGEIYKCRWRGTLVAAKIIKSAKIRRDWTNRRLQAQLATGKNVDEAIRELDEAVTQVDDTDKNEAIADFRQEISVLKSLRHPQIVLLLAYSTTENYECLISELMKCSLLDVFTAHLVQGTRMPLRKKIMYATQLAQGMNYLHTCKPPIIHRDLKPANLLIDHSGVLKISDFGLSKVRPDPGKNETEAFVMTGETGSYRFMAPEVFRHESYNETVDIYSYAMILFYLLVGRPPWPNLAGLDAVRKASDEGDRPNIPRDLDQRIQNLLKECWDDSPSARPRFSAIIACLSDYSRAAFHQDSNDVLVSANDEGSCNCVVQ